jgi:hypothetical protein
MEKFSEEHIRRVRAEAEKREVAEGRTSEARCYRLQLEISQLRHQFMSASADHHESEGKLRKASQNLKRHC